MRLGTDYRILSFSELKNYLNQKKVCVVVVFDLETNGLSPKSSVLECGAMKYEIDYLQKRYGTLDVIDRYYFPREPFNNNAVQVNGLNKEIIIEKRSGETWPKYFDEDHYIEDFLGNCDVMIAHNIFFDLGFIEALKPKKYFCTMRSNLKHFSKYPKLEEAAGYYNVKCEKQNLHNAIYDVHITSGIFFHQFGIAI